MAKGANNRKPNGDAENNGARNHNNAVLPAELNPAILAYSAVLTAVLVGVFLYSIFWVEKAQDVSILALAINAGAMGALMSIMHRVLQGKGKQTERQPAKRTSLANPRGLTFAVASAAVGALSAGALYCLFAGNILSGGAFFPEFACPNGATCTTVDGFINKYAPAKEQDYARLFIWSFVAGFAERMVPDKLRSLFSFDKE